MMVVFGYMWYMLIMVVLSDFCELVWNWNCFSIVLLVLCMVIWNGLGVMVV